MHIVNEIRSEFEAYIIHFGTQKRSVILIKFLTETELNRFTNKIMLQYLFIYEMQYT